MSPPPGNRSGQRREPHKFGVPGFNPETETGLGDLIKRATSTLGIKPCGGCRERAARMNSWMVLTGRR